MVGSPLNPVKMNIYSQIRKKMQAETDKKNDETYHEKLDQYRKLVSNNKSAFLTLINTSLDNKDSWATKGFWFWQKKWFVLIDDFDSLSPVKTDIDDCIKCTVIRDMLNTEFEENDIDLNTRCECLSAPYLEPYCRLIVEGRF